MSARQVSAAWPPKIPGTRDRVARTLSFVRFGRVRSTSSPDLFIWMFFDAAKIAIEIVADAGAGIEPPRREDIAEQLFEAVRGSHPEIGPWAVRADIWDAYHDMADLVREWCERAWPAESDWLVRQPPPVFEREPTMCPVCRRGWPA